MPWNSKRSLMTHPDAIFFTNFVQKSFSTATGVLTQVSESFHLLSPVIAPSRICLSSCFLE